MATIKAHRKRWRLWEGRIGKTLYRVMRIPPRDKPHLNDPQVAVEYFTKEGGTTGSWLEVSTQESIQVLAHALIEWHGAGQQVRSLLSDVEVGTPD